MGSRELRPPTFAEVAAELAREESTPAWTGQECRRCGFPLLLHAAYAICPGTLADLFDPMPRSTTP